MSCACCIVVSRERHRERERGPGAGGKAARAARRGTGALAQPGASALMWIGEMIWLKTRWIPPT